MRQYSVRWLLRFGLACLLLLSGTIARPQQAAGPTTPNLVDSWLVTVDGERRQRILRIFTQTQAPDGSLALDATYGWVDDTRLPIKAQVAPTPSGLRLVLTTPSKSELDATLTDAGDFRGNFTAPKAQAKGVTVARMTTTDAQATGPAGALEDAGSLSASVSTTEQRRLREVLRRQPPENALKATLSEFYKEQSDAALALGDGHAQLFIGRKFADAALGSRNESLAGYRIWRAEAEFGDKRRGFELGEDRVKDRQYGDARAGMAATLALEYLGHAYNLKRAEELLTQAQELQKAVRPSSIRYSLTNQLQIETTRTVIENFKGRYREAISAGESAVAMADRVLADTRFIRDVAGPEVRSSLLRGHLNAHRMNWEALATSGQLALAEAKATEYYSAVVLKEKFSNQPMAEYLAVLGALKWGNQKFAEATAILTRAMQLGEAAGMTANSTVMYNGTGYLTTSLIATGKTDDAVRLCDRRIALKQRYFQNACALAYHLNGKYDASVRLMRANAKFWSALYPRDNFRIVLAEGLLGASLIAKGERAEGKQLLETVVSFLPDAKARTPGSQAGNFPYVERLILNAYLDVLSDEHAKATDASARRALATEAFKVAAMMRSSVVQQSAQDAALRAAAGEAGLSDLVRTLQDGQAETKVLYDFLTRQLSEPQERQLPSVVASMRARIAELDTQQKKIETTIAQKFPAFRELMRPSVPTPQEIAERLQPDEAFLLLSPAPGGTHAWAISRDGFAYATSPLKAAELEPMVQRLRRTLELDQNDLLHAFDAATASQLYRQLVVPVETVLAGKSALLVSASGALSKLPFGVLLTAEAPTADPTENPYLIRKYAISHAVSPAAWLAQVKYERRARQTASGFVGFGDPVFSAAAPATGGGTRAAGGKRVRNLSIGRVSDAPPSEAPAASGSNVTYASLSPLPETRDEVLAIASTLKADPNRDVYLNLRASRKNVMEARIADRSVVMFATHGLMAGDLPSLDEPGLALSVTSPNDAEPVLKLSDILKLRLNADWVVLSACNTAAGDKASDETYSGLGRAFFYAGARALLLTHWAVETNSAKAITTQLFERFSASTQITRAEALRQTQLAMLGSKATGGPDYGHPFFWAPFALVGDGGR